MDSINSTFGIGRLIAKHLTNALDAAEQQQLDAWLKADEKHTAIFNRIVVHESLAAALIETQQINTELALANVKTRLGQQPEQQPAAQTAKLWKRYIGVAAAVAAIAFGIWFFTAPRHLDDRRDLLNYANDIAPGGNRATLTLANGKTINLSEAKTGIVVNDDITYNDGTGIAPLSSRANAKDLSVQTLITPRGGTYSIILQDGTRVWLNADSKLEFFSDYRNKLQRIVKLTGEGYFEVAKVFSPARDGKGPQRVPFIVESNGQQVEVLGTHFNVSAYKGESIRTILLEGSVRIEGKLILKPGQQSEIGLDRRVTVTQVDPETAIAWKKGYFKFNNEPLASIMLKISRWYNVEIIYQDESVKTAGVGGTVSRFDNVSQILNKLQLTGKAHFKIEGQKIIVSK